MIVATDNFGLPEAAPTERHLSFSQLSTYANCPKRYELKYIQGLRGPVSGAMLAGRAIHKTIEWAEHNSVHEQDFQSADPQLRTHFQQTFKELVDETGGPDEPRWGGRGRGENYLWWMNQGPTMLRRYLSIRFLDREHGLKTLEAGVEMSISAPLPWGTVVKGFIDLAQFVDANGEVRIRDYKSGTFPGDPIQLAKYAWLLGEFHGIHPEIGEFVYLRRNEPSERVVEISLTRFVPLVIPEFESLERGIEVGFFPMRRGPLCKSCEVRFACPFGQLLEED